MAFTWTNSATDKKIEGDDKTTSIMKELKDKIQTLYTALGLGTVTYTEDMSDNFIRTTNITELRTKIDNADNNKIQCTSVNTSVLTSVLAEHLNSYRNGYDGSYYGSDYSGYNSQTNTSYDSATNSIYHSATNTNYDYSYDSGNYHEFYNSLGGCEVVG
jgi:hypothetical protein